MLTTVAISNYRSLRDLVVPLQKLNVVTGSNGSGKSNLYRALRLLADTASRSRGLVDRAGERHPIDSLGWTGIRVKDAYAHIWQKELL